MATIDYGSRRATAVDGPSWEQRATVIITAAASFPAGAVLVTVYMCFALAAIQLGRLPRINSAEAGMPLSLQFMTFGIGAVLVPALIGAVAWLCFRRRPALQVAAAIVLTISTWVLLFTDPLGALAWYLD